MKYLKQFFWILLATCFGELLKYLLPLAIPASVYGLCIMMVLLCLKVIKVDDVKDTGFFLIEIMPLMFIPAAVELIAMYDQLKSVLIPFLVITVISTILVMIVSGRVTQLALKKENKHE